jgi:predicted RecB family endonuclease
MHKETLSEIMPDLFNHIEECYNTAIELINRSNQNVHSEKLLEAIEHCSDMAENNRMTNPECSYEHFQLYCWLKELQYRRKNERFDQTLVSDLIISAISLSRFLSTSQLRELLSKMKK